MAKFLNTSKAYAEIEDITGKAQKGLVLISPYIKFPGTFLERLKDVDKRNIKITIVCREEDLSAETKSDLKKLNNLELCFLANLHAKCFYNEASMVITSLNLYDYSQQNNREMGVLVTLKDDCELFTEALSEANFIIRSATVFKSSKIKDAIEFGGSFLKDINKFLNQDIGMVLSSNTSSDATKGHCIRCGKSITQNISKPYCPDCFEKWNEWKKPDYKEDYCHLCGKKAATSMKKPQCFACYIKSQK
jgi:hypothetical protein